MNKKTNPLKHPDQRVGVFIDVQNMYYSAKNLFGAKVNFGNIVREATAGRKLIRAGDIFVGWRQPVRRIF